MIDLTVKSLLDFVMISIILETKTDFLAASALRGGATAHYDNSHLIHITTGNLFRSICYGTDFVLDKRILPLLANQPC